MASRGVILDITKKQENVPLGGSGIQLSLETNLVTEGFSPEKSLGFVQPPGQYWKYPGKNTLTARDGIENTPDIFQKSDK